MSLGYTTLNDFISHDGDGGSVGPIKTANTAKDGTGTVNTLLTAGAGGSRVNRLRFMAAGSNVRSLARIFINNGSTPATASNNVLYKEIALPATVINELEPQPEVVVAPNLMLAAGYKLLVVIATAVAAGWYCSAERDDF